MKPKPARLIYTDINYINSHVTHILIYYVLNTHNIKLPTIKATYFLDIKKREVAHETTVSNSQVLKNNVKVF